MEKYKKKHAKIKSQNTSSNMEWKIELTARPYSLSNIQDYFKYILKKHETVPDNPSIMIYVNNIENRITFKIKTGYYIELLTFETMKLLGSTKIK